ncbi:GumC family protein [Sphingomonas gei]|nr:polysaccharide biosynthesis tyrosine autokinase [Sphingomonas gei]
MRRTDGDRADIWDGSPSSLEEPRQIPLLLQYWRVVLRWKWLIVAIITVALVAGLIVTLFMTRQYTAVVSIEISRQADKIVNVQGVKPEVSSVDTEFYQTQYSLLRARSLAERVSADLKLAESAEFFEAFGVDMSEGGLFAGPRPGRLTAQQREKRNKVAADLLQGNISISPVRGSSLVEVRFTSPNPALSQRVANAWANAFIAANLDRKFDASSYARKFLESRLAQLRQRLEESERKVVEYAADQKIVNIPGNQEGAGERSLVADDLARLNGELAEAIADRVKAESRVSSGGGATVESLSNNAITALRTKRAEVASEYANLLTKFEPGYPAAAALASQLKELDRAIGQEEGRVRQGTSKTYSDARAREIDLRQRVDTLVSSALDLRRRSIQYNMHQRDADTNRQLYDALLQRYKEIGVAGGIGTNNIMVVDPAQLPLQPSSPRLFLNLLIALVLGAGLSAVSVLALEQIDEAIKDPSEVVRAMGVPNLGTIPAVAEGEPRAILLDRKSPMAEAYLSVQTNLRFSTDHGIPRSLAVTSTRASEGKSTTAYALAQTLARIGRSVILVDGDMRSPSVHVLLDIPNARGTSNFLAGEDDVATMVVWVPGLGINAMPAGPQPPNAAELLNSSRLQLLIDRLLETHDHVIIDSPPVLGLADAPLIGSQVEGVIYAVEANGARSSIIRAATARLRSANVNLLGAVLTKFDAKKAHFGYGYEYGYGYGEKDAVNAA